MALIVTEIEQTTARARAWWWLVVAAVIHVAWSAPAPAAPRVVASIAPVHSLAAAVMGDLGKPVQIVRGYGSPHAYQMRPSDAANLRDADLVLWIGPSLETFLQRPLAARGDGARVVTLSALPGLSLLANRSGGVHDTHEHNDAEGSSYDPHIWLNPHNAKLMAGAIAIALAELDPGNAESYQDNARRLNERIDRMNTRIAERLAPVAGVPFIVFHDAFRYFEESYGLNAVGSLTAGPDHTASARRVQALKREIAQSAVRCVFHEPQFKSALVPVLLEDSGARAGVLDPLGSDIPAGPDAYIQLMDANADALAACLL